MGDKNKKKWFLAAREGDVEGMKAALGSVSIDVEDSSKDYGPYRGLAAIHHASLRGRPAAVQWLLEAGADVNLPDAHGRTALHHAVGAGQADTEVVGVLLAGGADPDLVDARHNKTALHEAANNGRTCVVRALLDAGCNYSARDTGGDQAIHRAACMGHSDVVATLLAAGAAVDTRSQACTPLVEAARGGHVSAATVLLEAGACCEEPDCMNGWSALHYAAASGMVDLAELLLARGASARCEDLMDETPLDVARKNGHGTLVSLLGGGVVD